MRFQLLLLFLCQISIVQSQNWNVLRSVQARATYLEEENAIQLNWPDDPYATSWEVKRRSEDTLVSLATVTFPDTFFIDRNLDSAAAYTYIIYKRNAQGPIGFTTIQAGNSFGPQHSYGSILIAIDKPLYQKIKFEIDRFTADLRAEGWHPIIQFVDRSSSPKKFKSDIRALSADSSLNLTTLLLIGNSPVAYSGNIAPDEHREHRGAWPADVFFADLDTNWTDYQLNLDTAEIARTENYNLPGDGKFDQSYLPSDVELMVGRIYLDNLPVFNEDRSALYKRYFDKNHAWRNGLTPRKLTGAYENHWAEDNRFLSFTSNALRLSPLITETYGEKPLADSLKNHHLFAFGASGGKYDALNRILTSADFATDTFHVDFFGLIGSYFVDWDSENSFYRAPMAGFDPCLALFWAGRPNWYLHEFAAGQPLGLSVKSTQNARFNINPAVDPSFYQRMVHIALMGDPTLRLYHHEKVTNLNITTNNDNKSHDLEWNPNGEGSFIYRKALRDTFFQLIATVGPETSTYTDTNALPDSAIYGLRSFRFENGRSGKFAVHSAIVSDSVAGFSNCMDAFPTSLSHLSVFPNPADDYFTIKWKHPGNGIIRLIDLTGRQAYQVKAEGSEGEIMMTTDNLHKSIYIILLENEHTVLRRYIRVN